MYCYSLWGTCWQTWAGTVSAGSISCCADHICTVTHCEKLARWHEQGLCQQVHYPGQSCTLLLTVALTTHVEGCRQAAQVVLLQVGVRAHHSAGHDNFCKKLVTVAGSLYCRSILVWPVQNKEQFADNPAGKERKFSDWCNMPKECNQENNTVV